MDAQKQEWGCVNLLIPFFLVGGAVAGWSLGSHYGGIFAGLLCGVVGTVLSIPFLGIVLMGALGIVYLIDRVTNASGGTA